MVGEEETSCGDVIVAVPHEYEPIIPTSWPWVLGVYLGVPLLLVVLRPEIIPDTANELVRHYLTTVLATVGIGGTVHAVYAFAMPRVLPRIQPLPLRLLLHVVVIAASVSVGHAMVTPLIHAWCYQTMRRNSAHETMVSVVAAMVVVATARAYTQMRRRTERIAKLEAEARQAALSAQLEALQARTSPHFLFNSLNTVASLIPTDPKVAEETVERLGDLFRYTLQSARRGSVKLADELAIVRDYLQIEKLRLGERLDYVLEIDPQLESVHIPPLILQPLVENAILHGIACKRRGGHVAISAQRSDGLMVLQVHDEGSEPTIQAHAGTGTALADLERRMDLAYGAESTLLKEKLERGYRVTLQIPLRTQQELASAKQTSALPKRVRRHSLPAIEAGGPAEEPA